MSNPRLSWLFVPIFTLPFILSVCLLWFYSHSFPSLETNNAKENDDTEYNTDQDPLQGSL